MFGSFGATTVNHNPNKSHELQSPPTDSIQCLAWSLPKQGAIGASSSMIAAGSWDKSMRLWEVATSFSGQLESKPLQMMQLESPILSTCFSRHPVIITGTGDNNVTMCNIETKSQQVIGKHNAPVSHVFFWEEKDLVISGSWDKSIKVWDGRSPTPALSIDLPEKVWAMDFKHPLMVCNAKGKDVGIWDFSGSMPQNPLTTTETPFRLQIRCASIFPDRKGFVCGSIEGRCNVTFISGGASAMRPLLDPDPKKRGFAFKAHRQDDKDPKIYPVNDIDFNSQTHTLLTAGSDGGIVFWDKAQKTKLKTYELMPQPVNTARFDSSGSLMAYASSYDWHKGHSFMDRSKAQYKVFVHNVREDSKPKAKW